MPRVLVYDSPQVSPNTLPSGGLSIPSFAMLAFRGIEAPSMPDVAGRQAQQAGAAMSSFGGDVGKIALDMQAQANQARFDQAASEGRELDAKLKYGNGRDEPGYANLRGGDALFRPDQKALPDEYAAKLRDGLDKIGATLGNDVQRQAFASFSNSLMTSQWESTSAHMARESQVFYLSQAKGTVDQRIDDLKRNYADPVAMDRAINGYSETRDGRTLFVEKGIKQAAYEAAQLTGASSIEAENTARKAVSNGVKSAALAAMQDGNPAYADALIKKYSDQMDADDILAVRGHITKEMDNRIGMAKGLAVAQSTPLTVGEGERAFNILLQAESGGRQFGPDGAPLTSPKGAVGIAQIMPGTGPEVAKLAGLPWDEERFRTDPAYNKALGMAYFQEQARVNGGDLSKAYAAYNAGPGALRDAVRKAGDGGDWLSLLPTETQNYVTKNVQAFNVGQGQPTRPTFADIDAKLLADPELTAHPERYKIAREVAQRQFEEQTQAIKQRDDAAVANAMRGIVQNGGRYSDLPIAVRAAVPPKEVDNLMTFAQRISKGDDTTDLRIYNELTNNPQALAKMTDDQFLVFASEIVRGRLQTLHRRTGETDGRHARSERSGRSEQPGHQAVAGQPIADAQHRSDAQRRRRRRRGPRGRYSSVRRPVLPGRAAGGGEEVQR